MPSSDISSDLEVVINGQRRGVPPGSSIAALLRSLGHDPRAVAVEHNGEILPRGGFETTLLRRGDRLEIVRFVQGG
jgi:sulfur carrier protein